MSAAHSRASSGLLASLIPPPLPRPPAWICAFTTTTGAFNSRAALSASWGLVARRPSRVATPYLRRTSFAWYSWIFTWRPPFHAGTRGPSAPVSRPGKPLVLVALPFGALILVAQRVHHGSIGQRRRVAQRPSLGHVAQEATH